MINVDGESEVVATENIFLIIEVRSKTIISISCLL